MRERGSPCRLYSFEPYNIPRIEKAVRNVYKAVGVQAVNTRATIPDETRNQWIAGAVV